VTEHPGRFRPPRTTADRRQRVRQSAQARPTGAIYRPGAGSNPYRRATAEMFAPGAVASASTARFCSTLNRRGRSTRPRNSAVG
jgi:hypothetical protein